MISYTRVNVNLWSLVITILLMWIIHLFPIQTQSFALNKQFDSKVKCTIPENKLETKNSITNQVVNNQETNNQTITAQTVQQTQQKENKSTWKIIIPKINLEATIAEGTAQEVMNKYVGHFENTPKLNGNVALAAHNRGYAVNYFQNLKSLKKGDVIKYIYNGVEKKYKVEVITIIKDTDWTYLQNTAEDKITLITCVENEPEYRRCIQGVIIN